MTLSVETPRIEYALAGVTLGPFVTDFTFEEPGDLTVSLVLGEDVHLLSRGPDYTLTAPTPLTSGGSVLLASSVLADHDVGGVWPGGTQLRLQRFTSASQPSQLGSQEQINLSSLEKMLDRVWRAVQELRFFGGGGGEGGGSGEALMRANNLSDLMSVVTARSNLGFPSLTGQDGKFLTVSSGALAFATVSGGGGGGGGYGNPADVNAYLEEGDTTFDAAIVRALDATGHAYFPRKPTALADAFGRYPINDSIKLGNRQAISGDGAGISRITQLTNNKPVIELKSEVYWFAIKGLSVEHTNTATSGGSGIRQNQGSTDWVDNGFIFDVEAARNHIGFDLAECYYGQIANCRANGNVSHGFSFVSNGATVVSGTPQSGPLQWVVSDCQADMNGGSGFSYRSSASSGSAIISVGNITNCSTYSNAGRGIEVLGNAFAAIYGVRINGGFYGQDGQDEIYLDSYGSDHCIEPQYIELAGDRAGGLAYASGVYATTNNVGLYIDVPRIGGCKGDGIAVGADRVVIRVGEIKNNGLGLVGTRRNGINIFAGASKVSIIGGQIGDTGSVTQQYGIASAVDDLVICGVDLRGNTLSHLALPPTPTVTIVSGCLPTAANSGGGGLTGDTWSGNLTVTGSLTVGTTLHVTGESAFGDDINMPNANTFIYNTGGGMQIKDLTVDRSLGVGTGAVGVTGRISASSLVGLSSLSVSSISGVSSMSLSSLTVSSISGLGSLNMSGNLVVGGTLHAGETALSGDLNFVGARSIYTTGGVIASSADISGLIYKGGVPYSHP